jgi:MHS family alpha-ketoglutarate permease-like MFS transporter
VVTALGSWGYANYTWAYITVVCAVGAIVYARMPETKGIDLR